jgi:hypothetical protein
VLIEPIAIGGTYIEEWRPNGGRYFSRFRRAVDSLAAQQLAPTFVLWQQGEGNAGPLMTEQTFGLFGANANRRPITVTPELREAVRLNYELRFYAIAAGLRELGVRAPIFASVSTVCGYPRSEPSIRAAQQALPDPAWGVYGGPDTDRIAADERHDGCHFNSTGIKEAAHEWTNVIANYLNEPQRSPAHTAMTSVVH